MGIGDPIDFMGMNDSLLNSHVLSVKSLAGNGVVGGGGGGGMNSGLLQQLLQQLQQSQSGANRTNQNQYKQLLASVANTRKGVEGLFGDLGKSGMQRIGENEAQQRGQTEQDLMSRGLGNTTIRNTMLGGVSRNAEMERQNLTSGIAGQKLGATMQLGQMQGDAILSRMNQGPDMSTYMNLIQQLAQSGGGAPAGSVIGRGGGGGPKYGSQFQTITR
jgi:hypothetical protein